MSFFINSFKMSILLLPLVLSACGDGWQVIYTKDVFPYGNQRTAGSGVVYIREKLMPAKPMNVVPVSEVAKDMPLEQSFQALQRK